MFGKLIYSDPDSQTKMRVRSKTIVLFTILVLVNLVTFIRVNRGHLEDDSTPGVIGNDVSEQPMAVATSRENLTCLGLSDDLHSTRETTKRVWKFTRKADHVRSSWLRVDTKRDEQKCPQLYDIARAMLNGEKIKLPAETKNTRWKFRERINLDVLAKTNLQWNNPWGQGDSAATRKKFEHYNVSSSSIRSRKYLLTYGHNCCEGSKQRAVNKAIDVAGVDYAEALDLSALSVPFQISHRKILRRRKGAGYWLWKSYVILKTLLTKMNDGDILIYQDAGMYFVKDAGPLFKLCKEAKQNILTFHIPYQESQYSKRDAFVLMGMDDQRVHKKGQTQRLANLIVLMKTCSTVQFMMEYLAYTSDARISTDDKNVMGLPNLPNFKGNRHDQTVFSLLSKKWGIQELRDPCTCGRNGFAKNHGYASGPYNELYAHDRDRS